MKMLLHTSQWGGAGLVRHLCSPDQSVNYQTAMGTEGPSWCVRLQAFSRGSSDCVSPVVIRGDGMVAGTQHRDPCLCSALLKAT